MTQRSIIFFDTSALVATFLSNHPQYAWATQQRLAAPALAMSTHSLAEAFKVLSAHPYSLMPLSDVQKVMEALRQQLEIVPLEAGDYLAATQRCADLNLPGGAIYDTLIAQAALKAGASALVTLNAKHFKRLGPDIAALVRAPQ